MTNKNKKKQQKAAAEKAKPTPEDDTSSITFGNVTLSNLDLKKIVKSSTDLKLTDGNPNYFAGLNEFATLQAQQILDQSLKNLPSTSGPPPGLPIRPTPIRAQAALASPTSTPVKAPPAKNSVQPTPAQLAPKPFPQAPQRIPMKNITSTPNIQIIRPENVIQMGREALSAQKKPAQPAPKVYKRKNHKNVLGTGKVNPRGEDSPFIILPENKEYPSTAEFMCEQWAKRRKRLHLDPLFMRSSEDIARSILHPEFAMTFKFKLDMILGTSGLIRSQIFLFTGPGTFDTCKDWYRKKFTLNNSFQMFYMDHYRRLFEVYDDRTLKQMLICHGAFERGFKCTIPNRPAKVLCIPTTEFAANEIAYFTQDSVVGFDGMMMNDQNDEDFLLYLPSRLTPDTRHATLYQKVVVPNLSDYDLDHVYNKYTSIGQLICFCQRKVLASELFSDARNTEVTLEELTSALAERFDNPYLEKSANDSINLEVLVIVDYLRKSKHQSKDALDWVEKELRKEAQRIIQENQNRKMKQSLLDKRAILNAISQIESKIGNPHTVPAAVRLQDINTCNHRNCGDCNTVKDYRGDFKECVVQRGPNPGAFKEVSRVHKKMEDPTGKGHNLREVAVAASEFMYETGFAKRPDASQPMEEETPDFYYDPELSKQKDEAQKYMSEMQSFINTKVVQERLPRPLTYSDDEDGLPDLIDVEHSTPGREYLKQLSEKAEKAIRGEKEYFVPLVDPAVPVPQENVTITQDCVDEVKISKTIIKVGMGESKIKEVQVPIDSKTPRSSWDEFKTPLGSVSTWKENEEDDDGFKTPEPPTSSPPDDDETFEDAEESTPKSRSPDIPGMSLKSQKHGKPASPVKPQSKDKTVLTGTNDSGSSAKTPFTSTKNPSASPTKHLTPSPPQTNSQTSLNSPALTEHKSTKDVLDQASNLLNQSLSSSSISSSSNQSKKSGTPTESMTPLQRWSKQMADAVHEHASRRSSVPEDPSLRRVQTEEEAMKDAMEHEAKHGSGGKVAEKVKKS